MKNLVIRKIELDDIPQLSILHKTAFDSQHFSQTFSLRLLQKYFTSLIKFHKYNYLVVNEKDEILGFIISGNDPDKPITNFVVENLPDIIIHLLTHPKFLIEKISDFFALQTKSKIQFDHSQVSVYLVAVHKAWRGKGIGKRLLSHFEQEVKMNGGHSYYLAVRKSNFNAISFYNHNHFNQIFSTKKSILFHKNL